jgi:hypothetical protein
MDPVMQIVSHDSRGGEYAGGRFAWYAAHLGPGSLERIGGILVRKKHGFRVVVSGGDAATFSCEVDVTAVESVAKRA